MYINTSASCICEPVLIYTVGPTPVCAMILSGIFYKVRCHYIGYNLWCFFLKNGVLTGIKWNVNPVILCMLTQLPVIGGSKKSNYINRLIKMKGMHIAVALILAKNVYFSRRTFYFEKNCS